MLRRQQKCGRSAPGRGTAVSRSGGGDECGAFIQERKVSPGRLEAGVEGLWRDGEAGGGRDPCTGRGHSAVGRRAPHTHAASKGTERTVRAGTGPVQERVGHVQWVRGVEGIGR